MAAGSITREAADAVIGAFPIPEQAVATRSSDSADWCRGDARDLRHRQWMVCTGSRKRDEPAVVPFDTVVDVSAVTLSDGDALAKKLLVLAWLTGTAGRSRMNARRLKVLTRAFDWLVRHRNSLRLTRFADLRPEHFRDFVDRAGTGGLIALVPIEQRALQATGAVRDPQFGLDDPGSARRDPVQATTPAGERAAAPPRADHLGVTIASLLNCGRTASRRKVTRGGDQTSSDPHPDGAAGEAATQGMSRQGLKVLLLVWEDIRTLSRRGDLEHDALSFDPLEGTTVRELCEAHGAPGTSRDAVSPTALLAWLTAAAEVVVDWSGPTTAAVEAYGAARLNRSINHDTTPAHRVEMSSGFDAGLPAGMPRLLLAWRAHSGDGRRHLGWAVAHVMTACLVLLASLAACSVEDLLELLPSSLRELSPGRFELTIGEDRPPGARRVVPLPAICAIAFRALVRLTEPTRTARGGSSLFRVAWHPEREATYFTAFPSRHYLTVFTNFHQLPVLDQSGKHKVTGDQFKSGFAIAYVHAVPGASMEGLTAFLGSDYIENVRRFVQGALPGRIAALRARIEGRVVRARMSAEWEPAAVLLAERALLTEYEGMAGAVDDVLLGEFTERALRIADRSDVPGGIAGLMLVGDVDGAVARVRAGFVLGGSNDPDAARVPTIAAMRALYRRHSFVPVPAGHAFCLFRPGRDEPATARCLTRKAAARPPWFAGDEPADQRPDYAHAAFLTCLGRRPGAPDGDGSGRGCGHAAAFAKNRTVVSGAVDRLAKDAPRAASPSGRAAAERLVEDLMHALEAARPPEGGAV